MSSMAYEEERESKPVQRLAAPFPRIIFAVIIAVAVFLRLWNLEPIGWMPDQYDRLIDAERVASGRLPDSVIYPPGPALIMALPVALFGPSVATGQAVTVAFSMALVPLAYLFMVRVTKDKSAGLVMAAACAISYALIHPARSGYVDALVVPIVVAAFMCLPGLRGRAWQWFMAYGLILALLFTVRPSNLAVALPLAIYWFSMNKQGSSWRTAFSLSVNPCTIACALGAAIPSLLSVLTGRWFGGGYGNLVDFQYLLRNLVWFWSDMLDFWYSAPVLVPLAVLGVRRLWQLDRPLAQALMTLLLLWPIVHAPFVFRDGRYMGLALFVLFFLASLGFSTALTLVPDRLTLLRKTVRSYAFLAVSLQALLFAAVSVSVAHGWPGFAAESDEGLASEMRPVLRQLPKDSILISAVSRAFRFDDFQIEYLDLFDTSVAIRDRGSAVEATNSEARLALSEGRNVYYLISHFEVQRRPIGGIWDGLDLYFAGIRAAFDMSEVFVTRAGRGGEEPWVLFRVELPDAGEATPPPAGGLDLSGP